MSTQTKVTLRFKREIADLKSTLRALRERVSAGPKAFFDHDSYMRVKTTIQSHEKHLKHLQYQLLQEEQRATAEKLRQSKRREKAREKKFEEERLAAVAKMTQDDPKVPEHVIRRLDEENHPPMEINKISETISEPKPEPTPEPSPAVQAEKGLTEEEKLRLARNLRIQQLMRELPHAVRS